MSVMFLAMVWHAQRRQAALAEVQGVAEMRASLSNGRSGSSTMRRTSCARPSRSPAAISSSLRGSNRLARGRRGARRAGRDGADRRAAVAPGAVGAGELRASRRSISRRSSPICSCAGSEVPAGRRHDVDLAGKMPPTLRRSETRSMCCSRTRSSTRIRATRRARGARGRSRRVMIQVRTRAAAFRPRRSLASSTAGRVPRSPNMRAGRRRARPRDRRGGCQCPRRPLLGQAVASRDAFRLHLPVRIAAAADAPSPTPAVEGGEAGAGLGGALSEEGVGLGVMVAAQGESDLSEA